MSEKGRNEGDRKSFKLKSRLVLPIIFLITTSSFVSFFIIKSNEVKEIQVEQVKLAEELERLKESELLLRNEIEKLNDPQYVANLARQDYYLSKEDELIFRVK